MHRYPTTMHERRLQKEVKAAQEEANENASMLKPMTKLFEKLRDLDDFAVIPSLFKPIMHLLLLIWTHSRHYHSATRFVTLMRLICNDLLTQARRFTPGAHLLRSIHLQSWPTDSCCKQVRLSGGCKVQVSSRVWPAHFSRVACC